MSLPPGPRSPPLVQVARWIVHPLRLLDDCHRRFGDVFTWRAPRIGAFVVVADPALIKQVLTADPETLLAGKGNAALLEPMLGKHSMLTLDGADHLRQRRLLLPAFHGDRMRAYATAMRDICNASIDTWPTDRPFALHEKMQAITLDVILQTVFGDKHGGLREQLVQLLAVATNPWLLFPGMIGLDPFRVSWLPITKLKRAVDESLYAMIRDYRRRASGGEDVLSMMIEARDEQGAPMSDVEIRDELVTLLLAGHETTATALAWAFDLLLANPETLERLQSELAAGRDEYLDAVIRETLRVRPIVPLVGRVVAKPFQLGRWLLPVDTRVAPSVYLAGQRAADYPDPQRFDPARWLGVKPDPYTWLPFGGGIRRCIGMAFAQFEMRIVLETVATRTHLRPTGQASRVGRRGITLAPVGGTVVRLHERPRQRAA